MGHKHAKFGLSSDDFKVRRRISSKRIKIFKIGELLDLLGEKKSGELWFTNCEDLDVESYPPKSTSSEDHILAPRGCCAPKFLHVVENNQVLLAHLHRGRGSPLQFFSKKGSKVGLKCSKRALITSELGGVAQRNFGT